MSYKVFDYCCKNKNCCNFQLEFEILEKEGEIHRCDVCNKKLKRMVTVPRSKPIISAYDRTKARKGGYS